MKIFITLDYEIYFGEKHGSVEKCIIEPTNELIKIGEKHNQRFCFFVDIGFVLKLEKFKNEFTNLENDYQLITQQINYLSNTGHDVQLHIHPHWEDSFYDGTKWIINVKRYKLTDFNTFEISDIVNRYYNALYKLTGKHIFTFRAGGWCLQPFSKLSNTFKNLKITHDSSVYKNGFFVSENYDYDFRNAPDKDEYKFENDIVIENANGFFTEIPISAIRNSPLFFWKLFLLGRMNPYLHKPLGDGNAMPAKGYRKNLLTRFTTNPVSIDGYNANLLQKSLRSLEKKKFKNMVVIGHPKALSRYSIQKLEEFIVANKTLHDFTTFSNTYLNN